MMMTCPFEFANKFANDDVEEEMDSKNDCERLRSLTLEEPNACIERRESLEAIRSLRSRQDEILISKRFPNV